MAGIDIPFLGALVLAAILVAAAYTFAMALGAGRGRPRLLESARMGSYATAGLVVLAICLLAYAFQTHDFRIRYVARYSDRSMPWYYLLASLWGGQDGSLLWWSFLLTGWTVACTRSMKGRFLELQPYVIATLMSILMFFVVVMLFAANPFSTTPSSVPVDGEGLNPLLQNYWMVIHPPMLYMGFVGWSVPFAFAVAALATGRLENEWLNAVRPWVLMAWLFLSVGLTLGMIWSYEELGWGGYWAWDPVENASFMPWLAGTAFLHSIMVQERYGMMRVWNIFLICLTFFMTIFGTFLTRSGLIASVHSFAKSDIGVYFIGYLIVIIVGCFALIAWRLPKMKAAHRIESLVSREFAFLLNNWILLGMMFFVLVATTFPLLSEWLRGQEVTVGPPFYNKWMVPFGIVLMFMAGVGPVISWRKATGKRIVKAFTKPVLFMVAVGALHIVFGKALGRPAFVDSQEIYDTWTGQVLRWVHAVTPLFSVMSCAFVVGTVVQEFARGAAVRMRSKGESVLTALYELTSRARRRYGGYIVHVGVAVMYIGFTGAAYDIEKEATLRPGQTMDVGSYKLRYEKPRMESDPNKRMVFTDISVLNAGGNVIGKSSPAKFIYRTHPDMPTTEVDIRSRANSDLYVIMSTVDPQSKRATFRVIERPLVMWIWIGAVLLILGTLIAVAPSVVTVLAAQSEKSPPKPWFRRPAVAIATFAFALMTVLLLATGAKAQSDSTSSLHAGTVIMRNDEERKLFDALLCMCGDCQRLSLATCGCSWAEDRRAAVRARLANGDDVATIMAEYREELGPRALSVPGDKGLDRALWAVPLATVVFAAGGVLFLGLRWRKRKLAPSPERAPDDDGAAAAKSKDDAYDARIDEELERLGRG